MLAKLTYSNQILTAILVLKDDFLMRFDGLLNAMQGLKADVKAITVCVTETEDWIGTNQDDIASLLTDNTAMKATINKLAFKVDDLENRSWRSNLQLVIVHSNQNWTDPLVLTPLTPRLEKINKLFKSKLALTLLDMYMESFDNGLLSPSLNTAIIALLPSLLNLMRTFGTVSGYKKIVNQW